MSSRSRRVEERIFQVATGLVAVLVSSLLVLIIGKILLEALPALTIPFITMSEVQTVGLGQAIGNAIVGTIFISLLSVTLASPLSIATAVYIKRYAKPNGFTSGLSFLLDVLAGTPSIVIGVFGMLIFVFYLRYFTGGFSLISGAVAMAILIMPVIEKASESAIDTVPENLEHASYALGARKWDTISRITIPYAFSGIITGVILGIGRSAEESAVVILTAGYTQFFPEFAIQSSEKVAFGLKVLPFQDLVATLPIAIYQSFEYPKIIPRANGFAAAFILIVIVLLINLFARFILWRFKMGATRRPNLSFDLGGLVKRFGKSQTSASLDNSGEEHHG